MEPYRYLDKSFFKDGIEEVTLLQVFDGDTATFMLKNGQTINTRFLAINAPECTKKIEPFGKEALEFVEERLENAKTIVIESETNAPELDTTRSRYLVYVWYGDVTNLKLLNLELIEASLAKLLIMNNVNRYNEDFETAYKIAKVSCVNIHGPIQEDFYSIARDATISEVVNNASMYDVKTIRIEGIVTRKLSKSFFISDNEKGIYVYNTHYDISKFDIGDKIRLVGQFSIDNIYGMQLTNIRGVEVLEKGCKFIIPEIDDSKDYESYHGQVVKLNNFYCIAVENIKRFSKSYFVDGIHGKDNIKIKMTESVATSLKKSNFKKGNMYNLVVGIISYRKTFLEERWPMFVFCNEIEGDLEIEE
ncbi:MAG: thermonuclease family protein [Bacilli bacterium]|nr:thermonuclease family protein [Bacilli bacterium]